MKVSTIQNFFILVLLFSIDDNRCGFWWLVAIDFVSFAQVYQRVSAYSSRLDNTVELYSTINFPQLPGFPKSEPVVTTVNLKHQFEASGGSQVKIKYEETDVKYTGKFDFSDSAQLHQICTVRHLRVKDFFK